LILQSLASGIGSAILRKRAAERLLFSENRFRVLYQESPIGLMLSDQDGIILDTNKAFRKILDCDSIDIFNTSFHKLIPPEFSAIIESAVNQLKRTGAAGPIEIRLISLKGSEIPVLMSLMLVRELDQKPRVWAIIEDISQRKKFESDLIKARDEATRANRSKSEFLANMSHEIRTPLNAIMGFSELLSEQLENSKHQEFVDIIGKSGQNLLLIINDILDLSRIEAGRLKIDPEPVKPLQILFELERIFTHSAKEKNLKFSVVKDSNLPETLIMDETRIRQVLVNLIGNAIKFTHHGEIILSVKVLDFSDDNLSCNILFEVKDTGIGIPPDQQDLIFQAFMQQEGQSTRKFGGTGLGLTITKRMLEMMNGDITVTSSPGNGSIFHVTLKAVAIAKTYTPISVSSDLVLAKSYIFHDQLILNVEDISLNRAVIKEMLKGKNLRLIEAVDGKEGLEKAIKFKPDLILMDMQMPVMDGYTATRLIKNDSEISHIPIVALTASAMKEEAELIKKLCDGYLQKPVSPGTLMSEIAKYLTYDAASEITEWEQEETGLNEISLSEVDKEPEYKTSLLLLNQLKKIREGMIIDEIVAFSIVLGKAGESSDSFKLKTFADTIKQQAESFRIDELMTSFNLLSDYLTNISDS
jgi:two-component system sensor histidine kinase EvgS